ncbi:BOW99_gp33 family protein [Anaerotignum sp.]|uniref:BOW99_gp33 family protein n=1 Tax=Anaerotignum sp. TaxID=2039241 RepID=UPI0028A5B409|nr:hypothetical protein [Anaerotignum sp.]
MGTVYLNGKPQKIKYELADGRVLEDMSSVRIPEGHPAYQFVLEASNKIQKKSLQQEIG